MNAVFVGPDSQGLVAALEDQGVTVSHVDGIANRPTLEEVGVHEAELYVLTDVGQATSVVVARDLNADLRVVAYTGESLPEILSSQEVLAMDPQLLDPETVAEELVDGGDA